MKIFILLTVFLIVLSCIALGQPGLPHAPDQAPLDGGLTLLAAAGGVYAWRKLQGERSS